MNILTKNNNIADKLQVAMRWIILGVFIDQLTKMLAVAKLTHHPIILIPQFLRLELVYNTGMAFGLLANARILFLVVTVLALIIGWKYYREYITKSPWFYWGGILFFAGMFGNFLDRLFYGKVTDFIAVRLGDYQFPVFNIADSFLSISVAILLIAIVLEEKQWKEEK